MRPRRRDRRTFSWAALAIVLGVLAAGRVASDPEDFELPGTRPMGAGSPPSAQIADRFTAPFDDLGIAAALLGPGDACSTCHQTADNFPASPLTYWMGSMMAQAAVDPLFYAQLDLANSDHLIRPAVAGVGDMCLRCHSPVGWLEGNSNLHTGMNLNAKDVLGVQCHFCHRMVDPTAEGLLPTHFDVTQILAGLGADPGVPPTFGNGMFVADRSHTRRGPYSKDQMEDHDYVIGVDGAVWAPTLDTLEHPAYPSPFHRSSNLCGTCHDVSLPVDCPPGSDGADVQDCFPIERTWTEWTYSAFAGEGEQSNCQSCHMSGPLNGVAYGPPCEGGTALGHLNDIHVHDLTGGNAFIPGVICYLKQQYTLGTATIVAALNALYPPAGANPFAKVDCNSGGALEAGVERVRRTLKRAAYLDVEVDSGDSSLLDVTVTNRTGHKLPTGYPEGRRMWLNLRFFDSGGVLIAESGRYEPLTATLFHDQDLNAADTAGVDHDVIVYTNAAGNPIAGSGRPTKVWEGRVERQADATEFHFVLNDHWLMDNRIPPRGWQPANYTTKRASPVIPAAYTAASWQTDYVDGGVALHADDSSFDIPEDAEWVIATLYYQTASREYIEALVADNPGTLTAGGFNRGTLLQHAWQQTGRSAPVVMTRAAVAFVDADADQLPDAWETLHGISAQGFNDDADADGTNNWQELLAETDPTAGPADPTRPPVDLVLVLDVSGSMSGLAPGSSIPKIDILEDSVALFIEAWRDYAVAGDHIGVIYFDTEAHASAVTPTLQPFASVWSSILAEVADLSPGGWTAMGAGMHEALDMLGRLDVLPADLPDPERAKHVVLFSNGRQNRDPILAESRTWEDILAVRNRVDGDIPVTGGSNVVLGPFDEKLILKDVAGHVFVHSIGIGVAADPGGTAWHDDLAYFARIQGGKHVFITRAFELEGSFLESLVETLKGNTLEYVLKEEAQLVAGRGSSFEIPVNQTASRFSVLISWSGTESSPPVVELRRPDGELEEIAGRRRDGRFYSVITRYLDDPDEHPELRGTWTVTLRAGHGDHATPDEGEIRFPKQLPVRVHGLLDDTAVQYEFSSGKGQLRAGDPLRAYAIAREGGRRLRLADEVSVAIQGPERALGNLLASYDAKGDPDPSSDATATPLDHKLQTAFQDPSWAEKLRIFNRRQELNDRGENGDDLAGDGRFSAELLRPTVPGHYALTFRMKVRSGYGHQVVREERRSVVVRLGPVDPDRTRVRRVTDGGSVWVELEPTDVYGNLLGPGYAASLGIRIGDTRLPVEDLLDGRYRAALPADFGTEDVLVVELWDDTVHDGPVEERGPADRFPGCLWILLVLLLIVVLIVVAWLLLRSK